MTLLTRHGPSEGRARHAHSGHSVRSRNVLVVGKNSYVGEFLCRHFSKVSVGSRSPFCSWQWRYDTSRMSAAIGKFDFSPLSAGIRSYL